MNRYLVILLLLFPLWLIGQTGSVLQVNDNVRFWIKQDGVKQLTAIYEDDFYKSDDPSKSIEFYFKEMFFFSENGELTEHRLYKCYKKSDIPDVNGITPDTSFTDIYGVQHEMYTLDGRHFQHRYFIDSNGISLYDEWEYRYENPFYSETLNRTVKHKKNHFSELIYFSQIAHYNWSPLFDTTMVILVDTEMDSDSIHLKKWTRKYLEKINGNYLINDVRGSSKLLEYKLAKIETLSINQALKSNDAGLENLISKIVLLLGSEEILKDKVEKVLINRSVQISNIHRVYHSEFYLYPQEFLEQSYSFILSGIHEGASLYYDNSNIKHYECCWQPQIMYRTEESHDGGIVIRNYEFTQEDQPGKLLQLIRLDEKDRIIEAYTRNPNKHPGLPEEDKNKWYLYTYSYDDAVISETGYYIQKNHKQKTNDLPENYRYKKERKVSYPTDNFEVHSLGSDHVYFNNDSNRVFSVVYWDPK